jgi:pimeloyl-ACP methyl ester carboxylesterase
LPIGAGPQQQRGRGPIKSLEVIEQAEQFTPQVFEVASAFVLVLQDPRQVEQYDDRRVRVDRIMGGSYRSGWLITPTRVLVGADDPNIRLEFLHGYEEYVGDLALEFVDGASHFVADDKPSVVIERALELFART